MASGDKRSSFSVRRGMTVLGKIPAVPKPINLPSQRLENRGLDPSVEIVPRGTFSWRSGRSPPTTSSSWGSAGLSSSPPVELGAWSTAATNSTAPSSSNSVGIDNHQRPLSAGSARPSSAGASRPLSASTTIGRPWGGATKLEEQGQPSRFNLTHTDFPTLGAEKDPDWRSQENTVRSNRPTSADALKERHVAHTSHYQSASTPDRPTSADATKERQPVYSEPPHADRPISADGTLPDKRRQQPDGYPAKFAAPNLSSQPPFADQAIPDPRHRFYKGVIGHGSAGSGPGVFDGPRENISGYPVIMAQAKEFTFPGALQHDVYFNRPGCPHGNNVMLLPVDAGPEVYGNCAFDLRPNQSDISIAHHPRVTWGPNHPERSGNPQGRFVQPGPPELLHVMQSSTQRVETAMRHEPEQRAGWTRPNVVYIGTPVDAQESSIPLTAGSQKFPRPEMFLSPWGHQPMHTGWSNVYGGGLVVGMHQEMPSSEIHQPAPLMESMPEASPLEFVTENVKGSERQTTRTDEGGHLSALQVQEAAGSGNDHTPERKDVQYSIQKDTVKTSRAIMSTTVPDILRNTNHVQGPLPGARPIRIMQHDREPKAEQNKESLQINAMSKMASQRQEITDKDVQCVHQDGFAASDSSNLSRDLTKYISKKKNSSMRHLPKGMEGTDLLVHDKEKRTSLLNASDGNSVNCIGLSSASLLTIPSKEIQNDAKDAYTVGSSKTSENTALKCSTKECKTSSASNFVVPAEEEKVLLDDGSKIKRNAHSVKPAQGRSIHEPHPVDRQHGNHGMVWTPKSVVGGVTKDEVQLSNRDAGDLHEKLSIDAGEGGTQPSQEQQGQSEGEIQVQGMHLPTNSQQGRTRQCQDVCIGSNKKPSQQVHHHRAECSFRKQGPKVQHQQVRYNSSEHSAQDEHVMSLMSNDESSHVAYKESVQSNCIKVESPQGQINQREAQAKQNADQASGGMVIPGLVTKSEGKKQISVYAPKIARNQHRQQHKDKHETTSNHCGQHFYSKEDKPAAVDEDPVWEAASVSATEVKKDRKEGKSRSSKNAKQHKGGPESGAGSAPEGHSLSRDTSHGEAQGEIYGFSLPVEVKTVKYREEKTHNQKLLRHSKQSAIVDYQERGYVGEYPKADTLVCESSTMRAEKKYVPKQITKQYVQQELVATGSHEPTRQGQIIQESTLSTETGHSNNPGTLSLGTPTTAKKGDMLRYTPLPARKKCLEGQQSMARIHPGQMPAESNEVRVPEASSGHTGTEFDSAAESLGKGNDLEHQSENNMPESFEFVQGKKEAKHYVAKSQGKQHQSPSNCSEETLTKEEKWQRSHRVSASDSDKRKEGMKLHGAKDEHDKQDGFSVGLEKNLTKETEVLPIPEQNHLQIRNEKQEKTEVSDHFYKDQNHLVKAAKSTTLYRSSKRSLPLSEDRSNPLPVVERSIHVSRMEEMNDINKGHKQDENWIFSQKIGSRQGSIEARESPSPDNVDVAKPRQNQRKHYQYQPVTQHSQTGKPQLDVSNTQRPHNRQMEQGYNRYEKREGPRRGQGQGYYYRASEHTDSSNIW